MKKRILPIALIAAAVAILWAYEGEAVSYTHLDVYKRQLMHHGMLTTL